MSTFAEEKALRAHIELIAEGGDYAAYFVQGDSGMWRLADPANQAAAQSLLDAKIAQGVEDLGPETSNGEGPSNWDGYTIIHYSDNVSGANYRAWFVDANGNYWKADNGNSDSLVQLTDSNEIDTLIAESGYIAL